MVPSSVCALRECQSFLISNGAQKRNAFAVCALYVLRYGVPLFLECNLASTIQRGFKALDAKCRLLDAEPEFEPGILALPLDEFSRAQGE
jgi:hypothetical protein